jgi:class 3 adenylate cyclase
VRSHERLDRGAKLAHPRPVTDGRGWFEVRHERVDVTAIERIHHRRHGGVGLHAGQIELRGDDIAGLAVIIAQRIQAAAEPGEILASRTVVDLVGGSGIGFTDRGAHNLKGLPSDWQLYALEAWHQPRQL